MSAVPTRRSRAPIPGGIFSGERRCAWSCTPGSTSCRDLGHGRSLRAEPQRSLGHRLLTLRDPEEGSTLRVTIARWALDQVTPALEAGSHVLVYGRPSVFERTCELSLRATRIEARRRRCRAGPHRGGAPPARGRRAARRVAQAAAAVLAAPDRPDRRARGSSSRDVMENTWLRFPAARFVTVETAVQGPAAVQGIASAPRPAGCRARRRRDRRDARRRLAGGPAAVLGRVALPRDRGLRYARRLGDRARARRTAVRSRRRRARIHSDRGSTADRCPTAQPSSRTWPASAAPPSARGAARCERPAWGSRRSPHDPSSPSGAVVEAPARRAGRSARAARPAATHPRRGPPPRDDSRSPLAAGALTAGDARARLRDRALPRPRTRRRKSSSGGRPSSCGSPALGVAARRGGASRWPLRGTHLRAGSRRARAGRPALEDGNTSLDEALALWERGEELYRLCAAKLDEAEERRRTASEALQSARPTDQDAGSGPT